MPKDKKKNKVNVRELVNRYQENCARIQEIADACEREQRERNEIEEQEYRRLCRENEILRMKMQAIEMPLATVQVSPTAHLREAVSRPTPPGKMSFTLMRETALMTTEGLEGTGIIPVAEQEMLKPLRAGLIYDKVGINIRTGLAAGSLRWPRHGKAIGQFADEGERLTDSKVDFDKLSVTPRRLGIAIPVTREDLDSSQGVVENVIREEMPAAIADLVNDAMFTTSGTFVNKDGATKTRKVFGPFVAAAKDPVLFAGEVPTRRELLKMKSRVIASGIKLTHPCWVMTENMKAELEDTKVDVGSGRFVCENDTVLGYPVFVTPAIGEGNVGFGDWSYQAAGFFGDMSLIVDPYTLARENATDFVLNGYFATATLYDEAFVLGCHKAPAQTTDEENKTA
ncbi:MAG: phage major capsid protein [Muribaculaceae bacterium]|nr:phage major capsid protein [Muribaculaceae bacterium]